MNKKVAVIGRYRDYLEIENPIKDATYSCVNTERDVFGRHWDYYMIANYFYPETKERNSIIDYIESHGGKKIE